MTAILEARDLVKRFGRVAALSGVSFDLERGGSLGLVGESGSGKSTLARLLVGLERADEGSIRLAGVDVARFSHREWLPHRRRIQMVFQDPGGSLDPRLRVGAIVAEPLAIHRIGTRAERRGRAIELLESVGLQTEHAARLPHELSGGQRQRVAIARALALAPDVLVCDEPTSALDTRIQAQILRLLRDLRERLGVAILLVSHDLAVVREVCRDVLVLQRGEVVEHGPSEEVLLFPRHPHTRALADAVLIPDVERAEEAPSGYASRP